MANTEMHHIQIQDTPMLLESALTPAFKLVSQTLVETTDRAGTRSYSHQGLGDFSYFVGARSSHKHLRQPFGDMGLIATVAVKDLRMELAFAISRYGDVLDPT